MGLRAMRETRLLEFCRYHEQVILDGLGLVPGFERSKLPTFIYDLMKEIGGYKGWIKTEAPEQVLIFK